jgi:hypothetical protein
MQLIGRRLSAEELAAVRADPTMAQALLHGDLEGDEAELPDTALDLDKSWHGIHYLLTGTAWDVGEGAGAAISVASRSVRTTATARPGCSTRRPSGPWPPHSTPWTSRHCVAASTRTR